jgi:signal transduction histidine kinase/ligand-binding sensor domain-containing protein
MKNLYLIKNVSLSIYWGVLLLCIQVSSNLFGQYQNMSFTHFSKAQGLSNFFVNDLLRDKQGFLWIATFSGLNRYDGYNFKIYNSVVGDTTTLCTNGVHTLAEDSLGRIWAQCDFGLSVYDREKDQFVRILSDKNDQYSLVDNNLTFILIDSKGTLWVGSQKGLSCLPRINSIDFYKTKPRFKRYIHNDKDPHSLTNNYIRSIFEDKEKNIWISSSSNIIDHFNPQINNFEHQIINISDIEKKNDIVVIVLEDNDGLFWFGTYGDGLISWDRKTNIFRQYKNHPGKNSISSNIVSSVRQDKNGILWICTDGGGISFYNKKNDLFEYCKYDELNPNSLSGNGVKCTLEDNTGVIWVGTASTGLNKYEIAQTKFNLHKPNIGGKNCLSFKSVGALIEGKEGNLWIGTDGGGLNVFDPTTQKFTHFKHDPHNPNSISTNVVVCLANDFEDKLWIGTYAEGLNCFDKKSKKFVCYKHIVNDEYSLSHNNVWSLCEDSRHNLWIGTLEGTLNLYDHRTNRFYHFKNDPNDPSSFIEVYMTQIYEDSRHYLWIATNRGLEMLNLNNYDFTKPLPKLKFTHYIHQDRVNSLNSSAISCIIEDHEGNMWFGTDGMGLNKLDVKRNTFTSFTVKDGLADNYTRAILEDNDGNLWISTLNGLSKFSPATKTFRNFDVSDGLQDLEFARASCKTKAGLLCFGGSSGFNTFNPTYHFINNIPPPIVITDFKIFNNSIRVGQIVNGTVILNKAITETSQLTISYLANSFSFEFAALDFSSPEKNKYAYKLAGFDNQWRNTDAKNRSANYTNLDPGEYVFKVKASNNDGIWNENGPSIKIIILPPWRKTWWFKLFIMFIFIGSIYIAYYLRLAAYRKKEKMLSVVVKQRTREISQANGILLERQTRIEEYAEELRTHTDSLREANELLMSKQTVIETQAEQLNNTNQQLINTNQQLVILNSTKDRFFSIIAHDLRNPFSTVSGFAEVLIKDFKNLPTEKIERFLNLIYTSSKSGNNLLENLLQWSRSQTDRISYVPAKINLSAIADETINLLEGDAHHKNISVQSLIDQHIMVFADENMLKTIFRNLFSNAIKFTPNDGAITITSSIDDAKVEVAVTDTGMGISSENMAKLFRIDSTLTTKGTANELGTGLGLILCKEFLEKHNEKIWVESEEGTGSKFKFTLPLV